MLNLNLAAKPCDYCSSAADLLFCRADSAFMFISCDAEFNNAGDNTPLKHERVWMCEQAPAAVTCKADAASFCLTCDRDIHSANPLARRHDRAPVVPFYDSAESVVIKSTSAIFADEFPDPEADTFISDLRISNYSIVTTKLSAEIKSTEFLFSDSDRFLDFDNYQICSQSYGDSLVPVQNAAKPPFSAQLTRLHSPENKFEIDFTRSNINSYNTPSLSHSFSPSSLDVGVVPDGGTMSASSYPFSKTANSSIDQGTNQVIRMDREARVMRYREERKNRKFEKTIRYASRKAYAETRPRVKGRFAKRTDSEEDIDGIFSFESTNYYLIADAGYGVVPSF